jgi:hypothetical protein
VAERVARESVSKDATAEGMSGPVDIWAGAEGTGGGVNSAVSLEFADVGVPAGVEFFCRGGLVHLGQEKIFRFLVGKVGGFE